MFALFLSWDLEYTGLVTNFGQVPFVPWGTSRRVGRSKNIDNEKASTFHETLEVGVKDAVTMETGHLAENSVCNRSGIIAQHGVSNAKPLTVDLFLWLPETNLIKNQHRTEVKSSLNEIMEVYLATVTYFMCDLLFENGYFVKF